MTFLGGELLAFLGVLGLPVLVHLLNLRRRRARDIPTIRFLQEIERTRLRRVQLRRWLLLAARVLFLLALVLAFARPLLPRGAGLLPGGKESRALVLLLDDSASSRLPGESGLTVWEQTRELATRRLEHLEERDRVWLVPLSDPREAAGPLAAEGARLRLAGMRPGWGAARLDVALERSLELLEDAPAVGRQLLLISDLRLEAPTDWTDRLPADLRRDLVVIPAGETPAAPVELQLGVGLLREGQPALMRATTAGEGAAEGLALSLAIEGETRARRPLAAMSAPWRQGADLDFQLPERGWLRGVLRLDGDVVELDNELPFVLHVPAVRRVGLMAGGADQERVLAAALLPDERYRRGLELVRLDAATLAALDPAGLDQLVLALGHPLPAAALRSLREARNRGVRLLLLPAPDADPVEATRQLTELGLPAATGVARGAWRLERLDRGHEVLASILEAQGGLESIAVMRLLELGADEVTGLGRRSLAEAGGRPLISAFEGEGGRLLFLATAPDEEWSTLATSGLLAPFLQQGLRWLDGDERLPAILDCGAAGRIVPPRGVVGGDWRLEKEGAQWRAVLDPVRGWLDSPPLPEPGHYRLLADGRPVAWVAVRLPAGETTRPVGGEAAWRAPEAGGWTRLQPREAGRGVEAAELGPLLLAAALALLAVEGWLATGRSRS